jgi:putative FmdB family regulatory protein
MPIYEYRCVDCRTTFEKLRPMSKADNPTACVHCGSPDTCRAISLFAAIRKSSNGETRAVSGSGRGCASCGGTSCGTCKH